MAETTVNSPTQTVYDTYTNLASNSATYNQLPEYYLQPAEQATGWMMDYIDLMNGKGGLTQGYTGNRIAGLDPYQKTAYNRADNLLGYATPYINQGANWMRQSKDWMKDIQSYMGSEPTSMFNTGSSMVQDSYAGLSDADPYFKQGRGALTQARRLAGDSATWNEEEMMQHLSPYISGVSDELARRGNENLLEDILPNLNSTFVGAGHFGSSRNADFTNRAIRDTQREILGAQANAMNQAYGQAADDYLGWGELGLRGADSLTRVGDSYGNLGRSVVDRYGTGADMGTTVSNIGGQMTDYGRTAGDLATGLYNMGSGYGNYGTDMADFRWGELGNLYDMGSTRQGYNQNILDTAYDDWVNRWKMPVDVMGGLGQIFNTYTSKVTPDTVEFKGSQPGQENPWADIGAILSTLGVFG